MDKLETLSSLEGRALLFELFHEFRYEKQLSSFSTLALCWRICTHEKEIFRYSKKEVTIVHQLGFFSGTALWMEEIVNRYYYSTINSFVYLGAAILLVLVGIRRFSDSITDTIVIMGVCFEALMLLFMFTVMIFAPNDDASPKPIKKEDEESSVTDLIIEVGEIATDFAAVVVQLEQMNGKLENLIQSQENMVGAVNDITEVNSQAVSPNPKMLEAMRETNVVLNEFKRTVENLNHAAESLRREEIEFAVRKEVEKLIVNNILKKSTDN